MAATTTWLSALHWILDHLRKRIIEAGDQPADYLLLVYIPHKLIFRNEQIAIITWTVYNACEVNDRKH